MAVMLKLSEPDFCDGCHQNKPAGTLLVRVFRDYWTGQEEWHCPTCVKVEAVKADELAAEIRKILIATDDELRRM